jgi:NADH-quinone oxidoreductase subunit N
MFFDALPHFDGRFTEALSFIAYATLIYANFVALKQTQLRRFFAYSGIAQAGFILIGVIAGTPEAKSAVLFYLIVYALATLGCFAVLSALDERQEGARMQDLNGLFKRSPVLCILLSLCLLTLAGIPPTAGFLAKFFLLKEAFLAGYITLVIVGLLTTILSVYYYLRPIALMLSNHSENHTIHHHTGNYITGCIAFVLILAISLFPFPLWNYLTGMQ